MKPFIETLRVTNPVRQSRASSREASLAWGRVTVTAKRRQRDQTPCDRAPKCPCVEPSSWSIAGAASGSLHMVPLESAWSRRGRRNMANDRTGFTGTWEVLTVP